MTDRQAAAVPAGLAQLFDVVLDAAERRGRLDATERQLFFDAGAHAGDNDVSLGHLIDAYLRGAGELWELLFAQAAASGANSVDLSRMLRQISESAVTSLAEGFESAQRRNIRAEETARRELIEQLLAPGPTDPAWFERQAPHSGFSPASSYVVAVAAGEAALVEGGPVHAHIQRHLQHRYPARPWTAAVVRGHLVVIAGDRDPADLESIEPVLRAEAPGTWHVGIGDRLDGIDGVSASYEQAGEALRLAQAFDLGPTVHHGRLLIERLLAAGRSVVAALVRQVVAPLAEHPNDSLLPTLEAYFATGGNMADVARSLNIGPRTVAYRLERVAALTGHSLRDPDGRLLLELAVRGRRLERLG